MNKQPANNLLKGKTCIVIAGPTAVGKTAFAVDLARRLQTSVISADSRQCFKEMNIGVAKPSLAELNAVTHYFVNSHSIHQEVNAAVFEQYALEKLHDIFEMNDTAVVVGGTGLYLKALCEGMDIIPAINPLLRDNIITGYTTHGLNWLQNQVEINDPEYFKKGEINNPQRLMRALEVKLGTGNSIIHYQTQQKKQRHFKIIKLALELPKQDLYARINQRVDVMINEGLVEEVKALEKNKHLNALQTVGYHELFAYFNNTLSLEKAIDEIKLNSRHYAKRQLTWFKKDLSWRWLPPLYPLQALMEDISLEK
jgi:tRNA dimethylallyltransferase